MVEFKKNVSSKSTQLNKRSLFNKGEKCVKDDNCNDFSEQLYNLMCSRAGSERGVVGGMIGPKIISFFNVSQFVIQFRSKGTGATQIIVSFFKLGGKIGGIHSVEIDRPVKFCRCGKVWGVGISNVNFVMLVRERN